MLRDTVLRDHLPSDMLPDDAGHPAAFGSVGDRQDEDLAGYGMASLIQGEVIPRLLAAHKALAVDIATRTVAAHRRDPAQYMSEAMTRPDLKGSADRLLTVAETARLALLAEPGLLIDRVDDALAGGLGIDNLLVDFLAPAARLIGVGWEEDSLDFIEVTMALWRLQEVVHALASRRSSTALTSGRSVAKRILFVVAPGDSHSFGSIMLEEVFRRAAWTSSSCRGVGATDIMAEIAANWFDVIAFTASIAQPGCHFTGLIADMRAHSRNPVVKIMIGGPAFAGTLFAEDVGADAGAADARGALACAEAWADQPQADPEPALSGSLVCRAAGGAPFHPPVPG